MLTGLAGAVAPAERVRAAEATHMELSSPDIAQGRPMQLHQVYDQCKGQNVSPALDWSAAPAGTQSFALTVHDPDAPLAGGFWHWAVFNLPATAHHLDANAGNPAAGLMPAGAIQTPSGFGSRGYDGPCPPPGKPHRYFFRLYALKVPKLSLGANASAAEVDAAAKSSALAEAEIMATFGR